jgi:hypothetical protein
MLSSSVTFGSSGTSSWSSSSSASSTSVPNNDVTALSHLKVNLEAFSKLDAAVRAFEKDPAQRIGGLQQVSEALKVYLGESETPFRTALKSYSAEVLPHMNVLFAAYDAYRMGNNVSPETLSSIDSTLSNLQIHGRSLTTVTSVIDSPPTASRQRGTQQEIDAATVKYNEHMQSIGDLLSVLEPLLPSSGATQAKQHLAKAKSYVDSLRTITQSNTAETVKAITDLITSTKAVRAKMGESRDPAKATGFKEFLMLAKSSSSSSAGSRVQVDAATLAGLEKVTLATIYPLLGKPLVDEIGEGIQVMKRVAKVSVPGMYADSTKGIVEQMLELSDKNSSSGLMYGINGPVRALPTLISSLGGLIAQLPKSGSSSSASSKGKSGNAPPPFAGTLLYRTLDPVRAIKYTAQITQFFNTYEKDTLATAVITQASRLKNVRKELAKRAADLKARQAAAAESADASYAVLSGQIGQIRRQHFEACKSFVRAVRNFVSIFTTKLLDFVRYQHGDAIAYMNYWTNATDLPGEHLDNIKQHNKVCKDISDAVQKTITDDVIKKMQSELYASDVDGALVLDQDDQYVIYELNTRFADWAQEQSMRVTDAFMTGPPSTIEEFMEPHQIVLYALKLVRVGSAAIAIAAAERLFQSVYRKRVYVYDEDPPNLAWFLGAILLIDLAIHVVLAVILAIVMSIFARSDNTFPINRDLMAMWAFDYFASTVPIALVLLSTSAVLRFKKYFRYKYEGQRAIRAMAKIAFYTYAVVLPIPFYRMTYG